MAKGKAKRKQPEPDHEEPAGQPIEQPDRQAMAVDQENPPKLDFPVVAIGASAGGLEAFTEFIRAMNPDCGMAFVFILHLPPDHESMLAEILTSKTKMVVEQVEEGMEIRPNCVYVIRPGHVLTMKGGRFQLGEQLGRRVAGRPVDDFFKSLAEEQRERGIGIILSGMGSNGSAGAQAIKAVGGLVIAQDPESAQYPSMPRNLIDQGYADFVLRPADIPEVLLQYSHHPYANQAGSDPAPQVINHQNHLREILAVLRTRTRQDFNGYKKPTVLRRIQRRMGLARLTEIADYAKLLRQSPTEVIALADDLLIHVTGFFRDHDAWEALRERVIVPLVARREPESEIRVWVTACSSGEEAYSLAMTLVEESEKANKRLNIKVFATDMAERPLHHARAGLYPGGIESEIDPERLARFFDKEDGLYRVKPVVRECVVFAPQNVLQDPPFSRLDIVSCRNLLIYLEPDVQQRLLMLLHFGLREGGALFLGSAETVSGADELYELIDKKARIYRRIGATRHGLIDFPLPHAIGTGPRGPRSLSALRMGGSGVEALATELHARATGARKYPLADLTQRTLLEHHVKAAVTIDRDFRVIFFHGNTQPFLENPSGEPTRDLMQLAKTGLRGPIRVAVHRAAAEQVGVTVLDGWLEVAPGVQARVGITASPVLQGGAAYAECFVVSFGKLEEVQAGSGGKSDFSTEGAAAASELRRIQDELQSTIEELQTSNEEHKAANEEITSINEELQSSNEELETTKEEMQSLNEELTTVNAQLAAKAEQLQNASNDLSALLHSTSIAVVFLDTRSRIRSYTPSAVELLDLIASDVGRPLSDLHRKFEDPELELAIRQVLEKLVPLEREVSAANQRWYLRRVLPYRTVDNRIDGVVITFIDITERRQAEWERIATREYAEKIVETLHEPLLVLNPDLTVKSANDAFYSHFQVKPRATIGNMIYELGNGQWNIPALRTLLEDVLPDDNVFNDYLVRHNFEDLGHRVMLVNARRLDHLQLILLGIRDVTAQQQEEDELRASEERFRLMVQSVQDHAIFLMDPQGNVASWNDGAERILGYTAEEVVGKPASRFFTEEDRQKGLPKKELRTARETGKASDENWLVRKNGERFWASGASNAIRNAAGELQGFAKVLQDLTARRANEVALRESELRLRVALSAGRMGTWVWNLQDNSEVIDESLQRLLGLRDGQNVETFDEFLACVHPDDRTLVADAFQHSIANKVPLNVEFRVPWPDGALIWLKDQGEVITAASGEPTVFAGACVDITERKLAEDYQRKLNTILDERVRDQTRELRSREERLRGLASQLIEAEQRERKRLAAFLHDQVQQLLVAAKLRIGMSLSTASADRQPQLQTISDLLDEALTATRSMVTELVPPLLRERGLGPALEWLAGRLRQQHGMLVVVNSEEGADPGSEPLREVLFQIARELLLNVLKHSKTDCAWVNLQQSGDQFSLIVRDQGVGFDAPQILQEGTTFGLSSIRQRLEETGGQLSVESSPGEGTTATVIVPINPSVPAKDVSSGATPREITTAEPLRILIADDHQIVRSGVAALLASETEVKIVGEAADGEEALEKTRELDPDVVLMDINMPKMNGIEATRRIKAEMPEVRVIAFSLHNQAEMFQAMSEAGAEGSIPKDAAASDILRTIRAIARG